MNCGPVRGCLHLTAQTGTRGEVVRASAGPSAPLGPARPWALRSTWALSPARREAHGGSSPGCLVPTVACRPLSDHFCPDAGDQLSELLQIWKNRENRDELFTLFLEALGPKSGVISGTLSVALALGL